MYPDLIVHHQWDYDRQTFYRASVCHVHALQVGSDSMSSRLYQVGTLRAITLGRWNISCTAQLTSCHCATGKHSTAKHGQDLELLNLQCQTCICKGIACILRSETSCSMLFEFWNCIQACVDYAVMQLLIWSKLLERPHMPMHGTLTSQSNEESVLPQVLSVPVSDTQ